MSIDVTEDAVATAKVESSIHPRYFVDHLAFLKTPAPGWQVIAEGVSDGRGNRLGVTNISLVT